MGIWKRNDLEIKEGGGGGGWISSFMCNVML
jgi:hypothetical protein